MCQNFPPPYFFSELTKKLELAKCLTKESLDICEHIFMEFNIADNDSIMNLWFNKVSNSILGVYIF